MIMTLKDNLSSNKLYNFILLFGIIATVSSSIISVTIPEEQNFIFIIPLTYTFVFFISNTNRKIISNLGILIINIVMLIRCTIYPISILISIIRGVYYIPESTLTYTSISLILYEIISVFIVLNVWGKRLLKPIDRNTKYNLRQLTKVGPFFLGVLGIFLVTIVLYPSLLSKYQVFSNLYVSRKNIPGIMIVIFDIGIDILYMISVMFLYRIFRNRSQSISLALSLLISCIIILSEANFSNANISRWGFLVYSISIIKIHTLLYEKYRNKIIKLGMPIVVISLFFLTFLKFGESFSLTLFFTRYLSPKMLDLYFMGIDSVSNGVKMNSLFNSMIGMDTMLTDMFSAIPLVSKLFDATSNSTPVFYHMHMGRSDIIIPTVVQSYLYFGLIGAPLFSMFFTFLTIEVNIQLKNTKNLFMIFLLTQLTVWFSLFMSININIIQEGTWRRLIFIAIIYFNSKIVFSKRRDLCEQNKYHCTSI